MDATALPTDMSATMKEHNMNERPRLVNVHIGKSAGTWLRTNIQSHYPNREVCDFRFEGQFDNADPAQYMEKKFFSAHIGHESACKLGGELITMLRNPFDRMVSLYYYWQEVAGAPKVVQGLTMKEFFLHQNPGTALDMDNAQTWQLAFGHTLKYRRQYGSMPKDELLAKAIDNLKDYAVVGIFENLPRFCSDVNDRFGFSLSPSARRVNTTKKRPRSETVTMEIRNLIYNRNDLDVALYEHVVNVLRRSEAVTIG